MKKRTLGNSHLVVSELGLGCMGMTKRHRLEENIGAADVELTPDDLADIDRAASGIAIQGARYPERLERLGNR